MSTGRPKFIVIDDNKVDCFIAEKIIKSSGDCECLVFYQAAKALEYIKSLPALPVITLILVDIQMPVMNGFEFVEAFEYLPAEARKSFHIYILSSSINENDIFRVKSFTSVKKFLSKPLTNSIIKDVLKDYP